MTVGIATRLAALKQALLPARDVLEQRIAGASPPAWCQTRNWTTFLLNLDDVTLARAEATGLGTVLPTLAGAPAELRQLGHAVEAGSALPRIDGSVPLLETRLRSVKLRKRAQLAGVLAAVNGMVQAAVRVVDVGAGSGHLTRLSAEMFRLPTLGLEQNPKSIEVARRRANADRVPAQFVHADARHALELSARDLAIGLHACGELGDRLVAHAALAGCDLALVSCCLQKISSEARRPLSQTAQELELRREHLGLSNLTAQPHGIETSIERTIAARQTRYALGRLLRARGVEVEAGAEMSGINRRRANQGLRAVAERALALRQLAPPSDAELREHETQGAIEFAAVRRLSLPRNMLSRALEVFVSLDRASYLEERGLKVQVATLFDRAVSPRNIGIFASREAARLPAC